MFRLLFRFLFWFLFWFLFRFLFRFFGLAFRFPGTVISFSAKTTSALPRSPRAHHSTSIALFPPRRQRQPSHVVLVFLVHISPPSRYSAQVFPHAILRRQRQLSHIILVHIIRPVLPLFPPRRPPQLFHIVLAHLSPQRLHHFVLILSQITDAIVCMSWRDNALSAPRSSGTSGLAIVQFVFSLYERADTQNICRFPE